MQVSVNEWINANREFCCSSNELSAINEYLGIVSLRFILLYQQMCRGVHQYTGQSAIILTNKGLQLGYKCWLFLLLINPMIIFSLIVWSAKCQKIVKRKFKCLKRLIDHQNCWLFFCQLTYRLIQKSFQF